MAARRSWCRPRCRPARRMKSASEQTARQRIDEAIAVVAARTRQPMKVRGRHAAYVVFYPSVAVEEPTA